MTTTKILLGIMKSLSSINGRTFLAILLSRKSFLADRDIE